MSKLNRRSNINTFDFWEYASHVGKKKDDYFIVSWFRMNIETGEIHCKHEVVRNFFSKKNKPLFAGGINQCITYIDQIVKFDP